MAQSTNVNYFINPSPPGLVGDYSANPVYVIGQSITLLWSTNFDPLWLSIWQDIGNTGHYISQDTPLTPTYTWTVEVPQDWNLTHLPVFYFAILNGSTPGVSQQLNSHYFNISSASASSSPAAATNASDVTTNLPTSTAPSPLASAATSLPSIGQPSETASSAGNGSGLSSEAKIGVGVGVSLGVLCLILAFAAGYLWSRRRRSYKDIQTKQPGQSLSQISHPDSRELESRPMSQLPTSGRANSATFGRHELHNRDLYSHDLRSELPSDSHS